MNEFEVAIEQLRGSLDSDAWVPMIMGMVKAASLAEAHELSRQMIACINPESSVATCSTAIGNLMAAAAGQGSTAKSKVDIIVSMAAHALTILNTMETLRGQDKKGYGI